jgi:hypothetical protein
MAVQISSGMDGNPLQFVDTNSWVWFKHDDLAWAPCKVTKGGRDVELENGETREKYTAEGVSHARPTITNPLPPLWHLAPRTGALAGGLGRLVPPSCVVCWWGCEPASRPPLIFCCCCCCCCRRRRRHHHHHHHHHTPPPCSQAVLSDARLQPQAGRQPRRARRPERGLRSSQPPLEVQQGRRLRYHPVRHPDVHLHRCAPRPPLAPAAAVPSRLCAVRPRPAVRR